MIYALLFYLVMSAITFVLYGSDKRKARKKRRRTPESVLLWAGLLGGFLGALGGMLCFRHKTRHSYFWSINIFAFVLHAVLLLIIF